MMLSTVSGNGFDAFWRVETVVAVRLKVQTISRSFFISVGRWRTDVPPHLSSVSV